MATRSPMQPRPKRRRLDRTVDDSDATPDIESSLRNELAYVSALNRDYEKLLELTVANSSRASQEVTLIDRQIVEVRNAIKEAINCTICDLNKPLMTSTCGHSYCDSCWGTYFTTSLRAKLKALNYLGTTSQRVPLSQPELRYLANVTLHPDDQEGMFQYPCPYCREPIDCPPIEVDIAEEYIDDVKSALRFIGADKGLGYQRDGAWNGTFRAVFLTHDDYV